ncbi:hypothetical protein HERIO_200 [Hepatospora eriocheir]|uniref:Uncharacterized protein n=1 Tax=Hepatospora eriocheir TaxID=1081669 RepID=A0A1X0QE49_9MICR|nr:hypothetical protein HERIO_200 [Hepatospora eriocheir]
MNNIIIYLINIVKVTNTDVDSTQSKPVQTDDNSSLKSSEIEQNLKLHELVIKDCYEKSKKYEKNLLLLIEAWVHYPEIESLEWKDRLKDFIEDFKNKHSNKTKEKHIVRIYFKYLYQLINVEYDKLIPIYKNLFDVTEEKLDDRSVIKTVYYYVNLFNRLDTSIDLLEKIYKIFRIRSFIKMFFMSYDKILPIIDILGKKADNHVVSDDEYKKIIPENIKLNSSSLNDEIFTEILHKFLKKLIYVVNEYYTPNNNKLKFMIAGSNKVSFTKEEINNFFRFCEDKKKKFENLNNDKINDYINFIYDFIGFINFEGSSIFFTELSKSHNLKIRRAINNIY